MIFMVEVNVNLNKYEMPGCYMSNGHLNGNGNGNGRKGNIGIAYCVDCGKEECPMVCAYALQMKKLLSRRNGNGRSLDKKI